MNSKSYEVVIMSGDDGKLFCCENEKFFIEIGAEAHALTINSTKNQLLVARLKLCLLECRVLHYGLSQFLGLVF